MGGLRGRGEKFLWRERGRERREREGERERGKREEGERACERGGEMEREREGEMEREEAREKGREREGGEACLWVSKALLRRTEPGHQIRPKLPA